MSVERLEDRMLLALLVTNTDDSGSGSLRDAIITANTTFGAQTIQFSIPYSDPGFIDVDSRLGGDATPDVFMIQPRSPLPTINDATGGTTINGFTQAVVGGETNPFGPEIVIDGSLAGDFAKGLRIHSDNNKVFGLNIQRFNSNGINIVGGAQNWIAGNYIGTDATGTRHSGNTIGIRINGGQRNIIGTNADGSADDAERNIISANRDDGIRLIGPGTDLNVVAGNYIGTDRTGRKPLGNAPSALIHYSGGVFILNGAKSNQIGTNGDGRFDAAEGNLLSANLETGVRIYGVGTDQNVVAGNLIGTDIGGTEVLGNGAGIVIEAGAQRNVVGTDGNGTADDAERNIISGNRVSGTSGHGVGIFGEGTDRNEVAGNYIGTDREGTTAVGNSANGVTIGFGAQWNQVGTDGDGTADTAERNIISGNNVGLAEAGVLILTADNNVVAGNYIGTDASGRTAIGNLLSGVKIRSGSSSNWIGTNGDGRGDAVEGNVISANGSAGVIVADASHDNTIAGNLIGTNADGKDRLENEVSPQGIGVQVISGSMRNRVGTDGNGTSDDLERNVISLNLLQGVRISNADENIVSGNYIGTDISGHARLKNDGSGVAIFGASQSNRIGTDGDDAADAMERNVISGNAVDGVRIWGADARYNTIAGNYIGTDVDGIVALGNGGTGVHFFLQAESNTVGTNGDGTADAAEGNLISGNGGHGIILNGSYRNRVAGNRIGTDANGTAPLPNDRNGVIVSNRGSFNLIGTDGDGVADTLESNLISGNGLHGVAIGGTGGVAGDSNVVAGNLIGTKSSGTEELGNGGFGVLISEGARFTRVGTDGNGMADEAERNVLSWNTEGVRIAGNGTEQNIVAGNYIGTNATGDRLGNTEAGVHILQGANSNRIGTDANGVADAAERNIISANENGILISSADLNMVAGNYIGTGPNGDEPLGNSLSGVRIIDGASFNWIGTNGDGANDAVEANTIAFNTYTGVAITGESSVGNSIRGNAIHSSGRMGIDLGDDLITPNDPEDLDAGPNQFQNHPQLSRVVSGIVTEVFGFLNSVPDSTFTIDFYLNKDPDLPTRVEGERFLGSTMVTTDRYGNADFSTLFAESTTINDRITTTATDGSGNTSEFSAPATFTSRPGTFVVTNTNDSGPGSLRSAIANANFHGGPSEIVFTIPTFDPGFTNVDLALADGDADLDAFVIQPLSPLPALNDTTGGTKIDGRTQTSLSGDTNPFGPEIVLDGQNLPDDFEQSGLFLFSDGNQVFGLNIQQFPAIGIDVRGSNNWIAGNYVGTDATGTETKANGYGISAVDSGISLGTFSIAANGNIVGTDGDGEDDEAERNVISGNGKNGVVIQNGSGNVVAGNFIGTDRKGRNAVPNGHNGILMMSGTRDNRIGTDGDSMADIAERNIISANSSSGVAMNHAHENIVAGNYIGTDADGTRPLGNASRGVSLVNGSQFNWIGTNSDGRGDAGEGNLISGNGNAGIAVTGGSHDNMIAGNIIGTNAEGMGRLENEIHLQGTGVQVLSGSMRNRVGTDGNGTSDDLERNIVSGNLFQGVLLSHANENIVAGNYIGTDINGNSLSRTDGSGVVINGAAQSNFIGTNSDGKGDEVERNLISANASHGVHIVGAGTDYNVVGGNLIGTDASGMGRAGNGGFGVLVAQGARFNRVGTKPHGLAVEAERNVVSANLEGVRISGSGSDENVVAGNYIGTDVTGNAPLGNTGEAGVHILSGAQANLVGTDGDGRADTLERNVISGNIVGVKIRDPGTNSNIVAGNYIGTESNGEAALGNTGFTAVWVAGGAESNIIGTDGSDDPYNTNEGNVISGNLGNGVRLDSDNNVVAGNLIGTTAHGSRSLGNGGDGVQILRGAKSNRVGTNGNGMADAERNIISSNTNGILIGNADTTGNVVAGNYIGTDANGNGALGNSVSGVRIVQGATSNRIGTDSDGVNDATEANTIAFNAIDGVAIAGPSSTGNVTRGNAIHSNGGLGIDLNADGVTRNDSDDSDSGPNELQNFPELSAARAGTGTRITGTLGSEPNTQYDLDFYANTRGDPSSFGEGERLLGSITVTTDSLGVASFDVALASTSRGGEWITATATDPNGNTSEFSGAIVATGPRPNPSDPPGPPDLIVGGGPGNDTMGITQGSIVVTINGIALEPFQDPIGRIIAFGLDGDDDIQVDAAITLPTELFGGPGNDLLQGGSGSDLVDGGDGDDILLGGDGDDELSGAEGNDQLDGGSGADMVDGGTGNNVILSDAADDLGDFGLNIVAPASLTDGSDAVRGQPITFAASFPDSTSTVGWDFGDGASEAGAQASHVYSAEGLFAVDVTIEDTSGATTTISQKLGITPVAIQVDAGNVAQTALAVGGTVAADAILIDKVDDQGNLEVSVNDASLGIYAPSGRLLVFAQAGDDDIEVAGSIGLPAWLYGDADNDRLKGGAGDDVLIGGIGKDLLVGQSGRDLLNGGEGEDRLVGGADDDLLISGTTIFDGNDLALLAITNEWNSPREFSSRTANLEGDGSNPEFNDRLNEEFYLRSEATDATVLDDGARDVITGSAGRDWFFANIDEGVKDKITDLSDEEFSPDLEWIATP